MVNIYCYEYFSQLNTEYFNEEGDMIKVAIAYDFDGTLAKGNIPEHGLLKDLGINSTEFWHEVKEFKDNNDADEVLAYMYLLIEKANQKGFSLTKEKLKSYSSNIPFYTGVDSWFTRINKFASELNIEIEHFIISSGLFDVINGTIIGQDLKFIFACKYFFDRNGVAISPSVAINYTTKTQYLFRINKGIFNYYDNEKLNTWVKMDDRPYPFNRIIYLGDGDTDIPTMKMTRSQGGYSIAVFDPDKWNDKNQQDKIYKLIAEDRAQYVAPAEYMDGSQLDIVIKGILGKIGNE